MSLSGDLRQVRHAQHLRRARRAVAARGRRSRRPHRRCRRRPHRTPCSEAALPAQDTCTASDSRASSPPEATLAIARGGWPGLVLTRNSIRSMPCGGRFGGLAAATRRSGSGRRPCRVPACARRSPWPGRGRRSRAGAESCRASFLVTCQSQPRAARAPRRRSAAAVSRPASSCAQFATAAPAAPPGATRCLRASSSIAASRRSMASARCGSSSSASRYCSKLWPASLTRSAASSSSALSGASCVSSALAGAARRVARASSACAVAPSAFVQTLERAARAASISRPRLASRACSSLQLGDLTRFELQRFDLVQLVAQQIEPRAALTRRRSRARDCGSAAPARRCARCAPAPASASSRP